MNIVLTRIQDLLSQKHIKASKMLRAIGLNPSTYYSWMDRDSYPSSEYVRPIAQYLGVSSDYLLGGAEEDAKEEYYIDPAAKELANALNEKPGQRVLFDAAKDLPAEDILKVIDFINQQNKKEGRD